MNQPEPGPHPGTPAGPPEPELPGVLQDNIRTLAEIREQMKRMNSFEDRLAGRITRVTGSMQFVYAHALLLAGWIAFNTGMFGLAPFDPFPFVMLAMIASVEAIFVSTFVLISQNRLSRISEKHAELDLQINLLAEHEITRLIHITDAIARHLGVEFHSDETHEELKAQVNPDQVLGEMARAEQDVQSES